MPRTCTICAHAERDAIDRALIAGLPFRHIAAQWAVSTAALQRHKDGDLPALLVKAHDAEEVADADRLLADLRTLQVRTLSILGRAEQAGALGVALGAIREARGNLELLAKLIGQLDERAVINVVMLPEWLAIRGALIEALRPYPEARTAVAAVLGTGAGT